MNKIKEICTEVLLNSLNSLIIEADKNNIERDVLMEHYLNIVNMVFQFQHLVIINQI